jgi:hypothetical protein
MGSAGKAIEKAFVDAGNAINDNVIQPIGNAVVDAGNAINDAVIQPMIGGVNTAIGSVEDAYNYSVAFANDTAHRVESAANTVASTTEEFAKAGFDVTQNEFIYLSKQAEQQIVAGVDIVAATAVSAYEWADSHACTLGITAAISMGCVAAFTPAQPAGAATSTTLSLMATPVLYTADMAAKMAVSTAMGNIVADGFLSIPGVGGNVDTQLLRNVCSNCIYYSLDSAALWATPAGVGIAIGAAVAPVVASLVCTRTCPNGFSKALGA